MVAGDLDALSRLLRDRLIYAHSTSLIESQAEYRARVARGTFRYRDNQVSDRVIRDAGGAGLVTGRIAIGTLIDGQPKLLQSRFPDLRVPEGRDWRMTARQSTPIPAPAGR